MLGPPGFHRLPFGVVQRVLVGKVTGHPTDRRGSEVALLHQFVGPVMVG